MHVACITEMFTSKECFVRIRIISQSSLYQAESILFSAQTIRLEILQESSIGSKYLAMTTLKDEIFLLYGLHTPHTVNVYDRDNMAEVKQIIPLPGTYSQHMSGCNASNCVYILCRSYGDLFSVFRISRDDEHKFHVSQWIKHNPRRSVFLMNVSANGSLAICSSGIGEHRNSNFLGAYDADGSLQHEIMLPTDMHVRIYKNVIKKLNGNLVLAYLDKLTPYPRLLEFDTQGRVVRRFQSSLVTCGSRMDLADDNDRMMIVRMSEGIELLDSEFNPLGVYTPQKDRGKTIRFYDLHYDCNRNEIVRSQRIDNGWDTRVSVLTVFRFTEELTTRNDGTS